MSPSELLFWYGAALLGVVMAGLGAGLETGVYSLNRIRLHVFAQTNNSARLLAKQIATPAALIVALLIAHNASVKLATHSAAMLLHETGLPNWQVVLLDVLLMIPLLFIFGETVPKDLFAVHADRLLYPFARPMVLLVYVCRYSGVLPLINWANQIFVWLLGLREDAKPFHPRQQVQTLVKEGVGHGLLSDDQLAMVNRVLDLGEQRVANVMTLWPQVITVGVDDAPAILWDLASRTTRTRFPVLDRNGKVVGVVNVYDALVQEKNSCPPIRSLMGTAQQLSGDMPLRDALSHLQEHRQAMAIATDAQNRPIGVVSIKDLIEEITGELANW